MGSRVAVLCAALGYGSVSLATAADDKADDAKAIQGTWAYETMEWNGKKMPAEQIQTSTITIDGEKFTIKHGDKVVQSGTLKLDPSKSPKTFDGTVVEGAGKGNVLLGVYKLNGDTLTACLYLNGRNRPTEFKTAEATDLVLVSAKRAKK